MRKLHHVIMVAAFLTLGACRANVPGASAPPTAPAVQPSASEIQVTSLPRCDEVVRVSAPPDRYGDTPIYVGNEQPASQVRAWAETRPAFEEIWLDRDHLGWITIAFSADGDARQAELDEAFPGVGAVVVEVDWTLAELEALQFRINEKLGPSMEVTSYISVPQGVVGIGLGVLEPERLAVVEDLFGDAPICVEGIDPAHAPDAGPQQLAGDGWRLLADEAGAGGPYQTGVAWDEASYERLWREAGVSGEAPVVDFGPMVVIYFGAVYGSSCPDLRLDDVVVDSERAIVHADIVLLDPPMLCTADANPHAYIVSLERNRLPAGPFWIQLGAEDPPAGVPEERTIVEVNLSAPRAVARHDQVHPDDRIPEPPVNQSGDVIEPGFEAQYRMTVHCGIEWLGELNSVNWRTEVPTGSVDFVPPLWQEVVGADQQIDLVLLMEEGPIPTVMATANGHSVVYRAVSEERPRCR